jgi:hypothetical protein
MAFRVSAVVSADALRGERGLSGASRRRLTQTPMNARLKSAPAATHWINREAASRCSLAPWTTTANQAKGDYRRSDVSTGSSVLGDASTVSMISALSMLNRIPSATHRRQQEAPNVRRLP